MCFESYHHTYRLPPGAWLFPLSPTDFLSQPCPSPRNPSSQSVDSPAIQPVRKHAMLPATQAQTTCLRMRRVLLGISPEKAPMAMAHAPTLEKPHRMYVDITMERSCKKTVILVSSPLSRSENTSNKSKKQEWWMWVLYLDIGKK